MNISFDAASVVIDARSFSASASLMLVPAAGNTCNLFVTLDDDPTAAGAAWEPWDAGAVTVQTVRTLTGPVTGIKATRTAGAVVGNKIFIRPASRGGV